MLAATAVVHEGAAGVKTQRQTLATSGAAPARAQSRSLGAPCRPTGALCREADCLHLGALATDHYL